LNIDFINGLAGSGKTHQAIKIDAWNRVRAGERIVAAMPTVDLIKQTMADLPADRRISMIVSDGSTEQSVASRIVAKLKSADEPELVFITHAGLKLIPSIGKTNWNLIVDEVPSIQELIEIPADDAELVKLLAACDSQGVDDKFKIITLKKNPAKILDFPSDPAKQTFIHKLAWHLFDRNTSVFTNLHVELKASFFCLTGHTLFSPFQSVLVMGANFKSSMLYKMMKGVRFAENRELSKKLKFQEHNGSNVQINFLFESWSRTFYEKDYDGKPLIDSVFEKINLEYQDKNYLWVANKQFPDSTLSGTRLPNVSHGLNCYQDYDSVVFLSSLNPSNMEMAFFHHFGISREDVNRARYQETIYQSVMRCRLRKNDGSPISILVMDRESAEYLQSLFIGSSIQKLDWFPIEEKKTGRPKAEKAKSNAERQAAFRAKKKAMKESSNTDSNEKTNIDLYDVSVTNLDSNNVRGFNSMLAENAITYYRQHCMEKGNRLGNRLIFTLALNLQKSNMEPSDIKSTLESEASMSALKKEDWKKNIKTTLRKLKI
jgi:hypothetical protein